MQFDLEVNGRKVALDVDASTPLLWVLRDQLRLTGTKYGCGMGQCGACTVHVDGAPTRACVTPASALAGRKINPDTVQAQLEGAVGFGLTAALYGEISLANGSVQQSNFHDYRLLRIHEMPAVAVHIVPSDAPSTGVGEPGVPPVAPALGNALFALAKKRVRRLPVRAEDLQ